MMNHELKLANLYVNASLECRKYGWQMEWRNTRMLELLSLGVQPDACIRVSKGDSEMEAMIEFTDALTDVPEIRRKVTAYEALLRARPVVTMWFTTSLSKAKTIRRLCNDSPYKDWFLIGEMEDRAEFLTSAMWLWSQPTDRVQFIKPAEVILLRNGIAV
jgi:phosphotransferase system HPr-like phosphotransfer protein